MSRAAVVLAFPAWKATAAVMVVMSVVDSLR
jgi:hypothetical protein